VTLETRFPDRAAAGAALAARLADHAGRSRTLILGLARGGLAVAAPVARALGAPLEVVVARKLGVPGVEEVAFGALAEGRRRPVEDAAVVRFVGVPRRVKRAVATRERRELERRARLYRGGRPLPPISGRTVIVVDDGLATGATLRAAGVALRGRGPDRLVAAVPVASAAALRDLGGVFDQVVAVLTPEPFETVSAYYDDFSPVGDAEVLALLGREGLGPASAGPGAAEAERAISSPVTDGGAEAALAGDLGLPRPGDGPPHGLVVFAHGGGSSRHSYRNRYLAGRLRLAGWATLRLDLLLEPEQRRDAERAEVRFDIGLITRRLAAAVEWATRERAPGAHRVVLFGASTGAAAALGVAAARPDLVAGVLARGGRVDLAPVDPARVHAPALLIVGGADPETARWNRETAARLGGPVALRVVRGAGHAFEESGTLGRMGELAAAWLTRLAAPGAWWKVGRHSAPGSEAGGSVRFARAIPI
jgi:putative phosphoribosyl transferase